MDACWMQRCLGCGRLVYGRLGNSVKSRLGGHIEMCVFPLHGCIPL